MLPLESVEKDGALAPTGSKTNAGSYIWAHLNIGCGYPWAWQSMAPPVRIAHAELYEAAAVGNEGARAVTGSSNKNK